MVPRVRPAPMTATVDGVKNAPSEARAAARRPLVQLQLVPRRLAERQLHVDDAARALTPNLEAGIEKDVEHAAVVAKDRRREHLDAVGARQRRELVEQARADAASLQRVGDEKRGLGLRRRRAHVAPDRDHALTDLRQQYPLLPRIHAHQARRVFGVGARGMEEPEVEALARKASVERPQRRQVVGLRGSQPHRAAVLQDDIDRREWRRREEGHQRAPFTAAVSRSSADARRTAAAGGIASTGTCVRHSTR